MLIDSNGKLGTVSSSRRYKDDIQFMGDITPALMRLRPVTFRFRMPYSDRREADPVRLDRRRVAEVLPDLAVFNADGQA